MTESVVYTIRPTAVGGRWTFASPNGWASPQLDGYASRELAAEAVCKSAMDRGLEARMIQDGSQRVTAVEVWPRVGYSAESSDASDRIRNIFVRKLRELATERALADGRPVVTDDDMFESVEAAAESLLGQARASKARS